MEFAQWVAEGLCAGLSLGSTELRLSKAAHDGPHHSLAFGVGFAVAAAAFATLIRTTLHNKRRRACQDRYRALWRSVTRFVGLTIGHFALFGLTAAAVALPVPVVGFAVFAFISAAGPKELSVSGAVAGGLLRPLWYARLYGHAPGAHKDASSVLWAGAVSTDEERQLLQGAAWGTIALFVVTAVLAMVSTPDAGAGDGTSVLLGIDDEDE